MNSPTPVTPLRPRGASARQKVRPPGTTNDDVADSFYAAHKKVYPREATGKFARLRVLSGWLLLGAYYSAAWFQWDGRQALLFDLPARKFYVLGLVLWPQDFIFLTALLIIAALTLFFFTALAGRLWCGYACPQTVWTESFLWMEKLAEGERNRRIKLDSGPWTREKLLRKSAKHGLWLAFSVWTGFTFVGYFTPIRTLASEVTSLSLGPWETFWILFYSLATYGNAGFLREQVCKYMCPYARFQGAMFDRDTLIITYDQRRGEPRGSRKRGAVPAELGLGECIDCNQCVQVCPTGIDIRKGLQYECIACAACIDVCDGVMDAMSYPRGLIRYSTQHALENQRTRIVRPRVIIYASLLLILMGAFGVGLYLREPVAIDVIRDRNALYRMLEDGRVENVYDLKILNKTETAHRFRIEVQGPGELTIDPQPAVFQVRSGEVFPAGIRVRRPAYEPLGSETVRFTVRAQDDPELHASSSARFLAPTK